MGQESPHWRSSLDFFAALLVGLGNASSGIGRGAPSGALRQESMACGREWAGVVVKPSLAALESGSPNSMLVQSVGELVSGHMSLSCRWNGLERGRSISVQGLSSPDLGREGKMKVCSCWEWQGESGCCGEWG